MSTNRFRFTDRRTSSSYTVRDYNPGNLNTPASTTASVDTGRKSSGTYKSIADVHGSGREYTEMKKNGGVILHPFHIVSEERSSVDSSWFFGDHPTWGRRTIIGSVACEASVPPTEDPGYGRWLEDLANAQNLVLIKAYAKMNAPDVLSSVIWHEREKTVRLIGGLAERSAEILDEMKINSNLAQLKGASVTKALASAWMTGRFGLRPTIADMVGTAKAALSVKPKTGKLLVQRDGTTRALKNGYSISKLGPGGTTIAIQGTWQNSARVSAGVIYSLKDISESEWRNRSAGMAAESIPISYYEEMPYTWLLDYFVKVGDWIQASTPSPYFNVIGDWQTTVRRVESSHYISSASLTVQVSPTTTYKQSGGAYNEILEYVDRSVGNGVPSFPAMAGQPLSFTQALDIAALAVQHATKSLKALRI